MEAGIIFRLLERERVGALEDALILEFGSGAGHQGEWLSRLGRCVLSDVYVDKDLRVTGRACFLACDVSQSPFRSGSFDLIFSNHVVEHLLDPERSFRELQRIGREHCLYAFAVPTSVWLLLSVPGQYWDKVRDVVARLAEPRTGARRGDAATVHLTAIEGPLSGTGGLVSWILPHGHGSYPGFVECLRAFRAASWRRYFRNHGFALLGDHPVLCYAQAAWPVIPTNRVLATIGLCSSRLFILRKRSAGHDGPVEPQGGAQ